jgi:ATP-dependent DNA helicase RecQ
MLTQTPTPQQMLKRYWGYEAFRPNQERAIQSAIDQRDLLMILPTGGGKSLCFQIPGLWHPGLTIVISPLMALMADQVQGLNDRGISAAAVHYHLTPPERRRALWLLDQGRLKFLYVSPEMLLSPPIWQRITQPKLNIAQLVIDEAHCLVQWGDSFRPSYLRLGAVRSALLKAKPPGTQINIAAFTATADPAAQKVMINGLQLINPQVLQSSPYRSNLHIAVKVVFTLHHRQQALKEFLRSCHRSSGIVYARTRAETERLSNWLQGQGFQVAAYHAGLSAPQRAAIAQAWLKDELQFVVATNAFGMGIDKPDVRWVVHFHTPLLLSEYLQEIGRAGRDGAIAHTLILASEPTGWIDSSDRQRWRFFEQQLQTQRQQAWKIAQQLPTQGNIDQLPIDQSENPALALALLQSHNYLQWHDPFNFEIHSSIPRTVPAIVPPRPDLRDYLKTANCRWNFLLQAFGVQAGTDWRCGHCDRCFKLTKIPE